MGRIRTVKPELFLHDGLFDLEQETGLPVRLAFIGLWCQCDRSGRFRWRPRPLKVQILPYDDVDFSRVLDALVTRGFVQRYEVAGETFGCVPKFEKHQVINNKERKSELPEPPKGEEIPTRASRVDDAYPELDGKDQGEGKGTRNKEGKGTRKERACGVGVPANGGTPSLSKWEFSVRGSIAPTWTLPQAKLEQYAKTYPELDLDRELRKARQYLADNPAKRPATGRTMVAWLTRWLNRSLDWQAKHTQPAGEKSLLEQARELESGVADES